MIRALEWGDDTEEFKRYDEVYNESEIVKNLGGDIEKSLARIRENLQVIIEIEN